VWICLGYDLPCPDPADGDTCAPPSEILRGGECSIAYTPAFECPSVENAYPPGCPAYEMAKCSCADGYWLCGTYSIPCFGDSDHPPDPCPAPSDVHAGAVCTAGDQTCASNDNAYPPCITDRRESTSCICLGQRWRCQGYDVPCGP
jgi:hypothetical protein